MPEEHRNQVRSLEAGPNNLCPVRSMDRIRCYERRDGGSIPSRGAIHIAGIQAIGQSHKLGPEVSNTSSATSFRILTANSKISLLMKPK